MKEITTRYLIVGQGLAGTCLSFQLLRNNIDHLVIDNHHEKSASMVAAGLVNPVVFKRLTKSWQADVLMKYLVSFYAELSDYLNEKVFEPRILLRQLNSIEEENLWMEKKGGDLGLYISEVVSSDEEAIPLKRNVELGAVNAGHVNTVKLLTSYAEMLNEKGKLISESVDYRAISFDSGVLKIVMNNCVVSAEKVIFCEGVQALENPFFSNLKFKLCKGDVLTLKRQSYSSESIYNNGKFFLPIGEEIKMGSTYIWNDLTYEAKQFGKNELLKKYKETFVGDPEVIRHEVGIRPTVSDRRPLLGKSNSTPNVYIFNGLGTKGAMIAPYYSNVMFDYLADNKAIPKEVDVNRFI